LSKDQAEYIGVGVEGPYKKEDYKYWFRFIFMFIIVWALLAIPFILSAIQENFTQRKERS
jgi:hypothetical protein